ETEDGKIYTGRNIENASYGATVCAERTAFFRAVGEGERNFRRIAVVGGKGGEITSFSWPCGICRQVMREFCGDDFEILSFDGNSVASAKLKDLLPSPFSKDILEP
ncbi:MAG: cytidine deaminase, partial [Clostridia bacterium]|nr:cytidine deaminase [Clostridia bacterium]